MERKTLIDDLERVLLTPEEINARVAELGRRITNDFRGEEVRLVGILKGAFMFFADLSRQIDLPVSMDFMAISSYGKATKSSGVVRIIKDLDNDITGKNVIIVEDIIDSGMSLSFLKENLISRGAKSLKICVLLDKPDRRRTQIDVDYVGFTIPDEFVVGFGLDYAEQYRALPMIGVLKPSVYSRKD
ncbi:MAG: hypoxanthine phosphoribosyltransferase [Clostridia bacterium]|nr:hypoxanthine phosphoribosyltransferase [Clostridia bacterium]